MKINGQNVCPGCKQPIGDKWPNADVWHEDCIVESTKDIRVKEKDENAIPN